MYTHTHTHTHTNTHAHAYIHKSADQYYIDLWISIYLVFEGGIRTKGQQLRHRARQALCTGQVQRRSLVMGILSRGRPTHPHVSALRAPHDPPLSSLAPPPHPPPPCPPSLSLAPPCRARVRPHSLPAQLTPHTLSAPTPRARPAGPGRPRAWSPPSAPPPLLLARSRTPASGPCRRSERGGASACEIGVFIYARPLARAHPVCIDTFSVHACLQACMCMCVRACACVCVRTHTHMQWACIICRSTLP